MSTTVKQSGSTIVISHTRGDTLRLNVAISDSNSEVYIPDKNDIITFGMKKNYTDEECVLTKTIPSDTLILHLEPSDTATLEISEYVFDISIKLTNGDVYTIALGKIKLTNDVYLNE